MIDVSCSVLCVFVCGVCVLVGCIVPLLFALSLFCLLFVVCYVMRVVCCCLFWLLIVG